MADQSFTNLDFEDVKNNLKNYLKSQDKFSDYDFAGSNINVLLDILAYNTFQNNFYTNMAISEMFLDSAQIKDSVVSHAKELNYLPRSRRSAQAVLALEFNPAGSPSSIVIPERTKFIARCGTETYNFWNEEAYTVKPAANGQYFINNVDVFQGRYVDEYFTVDGTSTQLFTLKNDKIDTNSIELFVKASSSATSETEYTYKSNIYDVDPTSKVFYLQPSRDNLYEVTFGRDTFGVQPTNGNIIHIRYRITDGEDANGIRSINLSSDIDGISSTETVQTASYGGAERESLESIKYFAPKSIQAQDRAVTENDYAIILLREFPEIKAVSIYGGDKLNPPRFGKVVVSAYVNEDETIRSSTADAYKTYLMERTALTVEPIIKAAKFMYVDLKADVSYNTNKTTKSNGGIESVVRDTIQAYSSTNLEQFKKTVKVSRLAADIDNSEPSIISNVINVKMIIDIRPTRNVQEARILEFGNPIKPDVTYTDASVGKYIPAIVSDKFTYQNKQVQFQDNGNGRLDIVQIVEGKTSIVSRSVGTVDYTEGKITITSISIQDYATAIKIYATPESRNIISPPDRILKIRSTDVDVTISGNRE